MEVFKRSGSPRYYGNLRMASGKRKQVPLLQGKTDSRKLLQRLQNAQDGLRADGMTEKSREQSKPLTEHLADFKTHLQSKGDTGKHTEKTINRISRVIQAIGISRADELDSERVANLLARWRATGIPKSLMNWKGRKPAPLSPESSNHYVRSLKAFSRWLWNTSRTSEHHLRGLSIQNPRTDRRHVRRALSPDELNRLIQVTRESGETIRGKDWELSGPDRAILYRLATMTGLRAAELASLCHKSIDLDSRTIRVDAGDSKHRRDDVLPLHPSLIEPLREWMDSRDTSSRLFPGRWYRQAAKIMRRDLELAKIPYVDSQGRYFDFHSLRVQFATMVCRSGIPVGTAMRLLRHSTPELTLRVYNDVNPDELADALGKVPGVE